jgi:hypothetical protein
VTPLSVPASLIVIPLAMLILYSGMGFLLIGHTGPAGEGITWILGQLAHLLDRFTESLAGFPGSCITGLSLVPSQVIILYACGFLFFTYIRMRSWRVLVFLLGTMILMLAVSCIREYRILRHQATYVFALQRETAVVFVQGKRSWIYPGRNPLSGTSRSLQISELPYELQSFFRHYKLNKSMILHGPELEEDLLLPGEKGKPFVQRIDSPGMKADFVVFGGTCLLVPREMDPDYEADWNFPRIDILLACNNSRINIPVAVEIMDISYVVADGSNHGWYIKNIESECNRSGIPFHSTPRRGCFSY